MFNKRFLSALVLLLSCMIVAGFVQSPSVSPHRRPRAIKGPKRQASSSGEKEHQQQEPQCRKDVLKKLGGVVLGPLVLGNALFPAAMAGAASSPSSFSFTQHDHDMSKPNRKSKMEIQFEMFKKGLDLTHAFKFEEAEEVYSELITLFGNPYHLTEREKSLVAKAYSNRGNVRFNLDRVADALVDYSKAIELASDTTEYWANRGLAFESMADELLAETRENDACQLYQAAVDDYDHAIILSPENHKLYINAGDVLTHLKRHDSALEYYRRALSLFPISPALGGKVALLEVENGNVERGTYLLDSIVRRNPDFAEMLLASAAIDWTLGRFAQGIDTYAVAVDRDPRLMDDKYLEMECHWPPTMMKMVAKLREAGLMDGYRSTAVSWFESRGQPI